MSLFLFGFILIIHDIKARARPIIYWTAFEVSAESFRFVAALASPESSYDLVSKSSNSPYPSPSRQNQSKTFLVEQLRKYSFVRAPGRSAGTCVG